MPPDANVLCTHCAKYIPRKREREHRRLVNQPYLSPPAKTPSRLRRVVDAGSDSDNHGAHAGTKWHTEASGQISGYDENKMDTGDPGFEQGNTRSLSRQEDPTLGVAEQVLRGRWMRASEANNHSDSDSDLEDAPPYPRLEDCDEESDDEHIDWDAIETGSGLSNWDQLGENYERDAAEIGKFLYASDLVAPTPSI